jgi:serine/threonine protein kinase/TolB-like protein/Tfp pilus assembly protein PilF
MRRAFLEIPAVAAGVPPSVASELSAALDAEADTLIGRHIGAYRIVREIGRGGMGAVYLAERADEQFQKQVAVKLIKRGMDTDAILRRFQLERQILASLEHPYIARLLDAGTTNDGLPYFIMEYVDGQPIDRYCETHRLPTRERLELCRLVCAAVRYAHEHQIIHRDLKPSNILVSAAGTPKLLDFGIAKLLTPDHPGETRDATLYTPRPMTPRYASPEQVRGDPTGTAGDVYALGVVLYELLTGHLPYRVVGRTSAEIAQVICEQEPEKPSAVLRRAGGRPSSDVDARSAASVSASSVGEPPMPRHLSSDVDTIVLTALHKEPTRRYASAAQLDEDLGRYLEGLPILARKSTWRYRARKFLARNKLAATAMAAAVVALAALVIAVSDEAGATQQPIDSIAVLPFLNASADPNAEYLSDGMTEDLINRLAQVPQLRVMSRNSVDRYKGREPDARAVGRELGVRAVLLSRLVQRGERVSISPALVDARDDRQLWGGQYDRSLSDLLVLQDEISREMLEQLRVRLSRDQQTRLTQRYTDSTEAYQLYLKGRYFWNKRSVEALTKGIAYFEQAVRVDPNYALAYTGLADSYVILAMTAVGPPRSPRDYYPKAKEATLKALELDETLAEAHVSLGTTRWWFEWDWPGAEQEFKRAIALDPRYPSAHHRYGIYLAFLRRFDEGLRSLQLAQQLDPVSPSIVDNLGWTYQFAGQHEPAIVQLRQALEIDPSFWRPRWNLAEVYADKGRYAEATAEANKFLEVSQRSVPARALLARLDVLSGRGTDTTEKLLSELLVQSESQYVSPFIVAELYAVLGQNDQAFAWLDTAYEQREPYLLRLYVEPKWNRYGIHSDPRFAELLRRMGLPPLDAIQFGRGR